MEAVPVSSVRLLLVSFSDHGVAMDYLRGLGDAIGRLSQVSIWHPAQSHEPGFTSWRQPDGKARLLAWHLVSVDIDVIIKLMLSWQPHVVHVCFGEGYPAVVKLQRICRSYGIAFGVTFHDVRSHGGSLIEKGHHGIASGVAKRADLVHIHCRGIRRLLPAGLRSDAKVVVGEHPAFECSACRNAGRKLAQRSVYGQDLVFVGRFERYKGIGELCSALRHYFLGGGARNASFVGRGQLGAQVFRLARSFPNRIRIYSDFLSDSQLHDVLERSAVCIMPYLSGTQSSVPYWAAQHGCHVLGTSVGCIGEALSRVSATLLPDTHPKVIARYMLQLDSNVPQAGEQCLPTFDELAGILLASYGSLIRGER